MEEFLELLREGKLNVDKIITHRFSIDEAPEAYEMIRADKEKFLGVLFEYEDVLKRKKIAMHFER